MIEIKLDSYEENQIIEKVVSRLCKDILSQRKYWGETTEEGHYSDFDKFKNQIANLIADKMCKIILEDKTVVKKVNKTIDKAQDLIEKAIMKRANINNLK